MASARVPGSGAGWRGACALTGALLWGHLQLLCAQSPTNTTSVCGQPGVTGKIYHGEDAPDERWPWQASLLFRGQHICGASLFDAQWVISAAHCFQRSHQAEDYRVLLGYHKLEKPTEHSMMMTVYRLFVHNDFNKKYFMSRDITLLQLHRPAKFTSHVLPVCLPGANMTVPAHSSCWATGWGMITEDTVLHSPRQLQQAELGIMNNDACNMLLADPNSGQRPVQEDMICAGDLMKGKSVCRGDSGGPLVCFLNNTWFLMGLSSFSAPCNDPVGPSVFSKVSYFANWIREKQSSSPSPDPSIAPPEEPPPALGNSVSLGTAHKHRTCVILVSSQTFLLWWLCLRIL
ncbi:serine protease 40-like isoform X2 [Equus przewalskii]|uniref:tryptase n=2 Tax=Equus TaxID=9789 RepID=F6UD89_HORSE|nr:PREDICTED: serine protease 40-like [Equus przewalskii]XP_014587833.2 serine protease 40 isoform X2 [Equus caballus]